MRLVKPHPINQKKFSAVSPKKRNIRRFGSISTLNRKVIFWPIEISSTRINLCENFDFTLKNRVFKIMLGCPSLIGWILLAKGALQSKFENHLCFFVSVQFFYNLLTRRLNFSMWAVICVWIISNCSAAIFFCSSSSIFWYSSRSTSSRFTSWKRSELLKYCSNLTSKWW